MPQSEAENLIEEVARKICRDMGEDPDCRTPFHPQVDFLWQFSLPTARAVTALIVERCATVADTEAGKYLPGGIVFQSDAKGICRSVESAIRSLSPTQPEAKEARDA